MQFMLCYVIFFVRGLSYFMFFEDYYFELQSYQLCSFLQSNFELMYLLTDVATEDLKLYI